MIRRGRDITFRRGRRRTASACKGRQLGVKGFDHQPGGPASGGKRLPGPGGLGVLWPRPVMRSQPEDFKTGPQPSLLAGPPGKGFRARPQSPPFGWTGPTTQPRPRLWSQSLDTIKRKPLTPGHGAGAHGGQGHQDHAVDFDAFGRLMWSIPGLFTSGPPLRRVLAAAAPAKRRAGPGNRRGLGRAIKEAKRLAGAKGVVLVTGSLFTVGEAKTLLRQI